MVKMLQQIQKEYDEMLQQSSDEQVIDRLKLCLEKFFSDLHESLDQEAQEFMTTVEANVPKVDQEIYTLEVDESKPTSHKIKDLMRLLDQMLDHTTIYEDLIAYVKTKPLEKLLAVNSKEGKIKFKGVAINKIKLYGAGSYELTWDKERARKDSRASVSEDGTVLNLTSTSCWNFFPITQVFTEGSVNLKLRTEDLTSDAHFYIGVFNTKKDINKNERCLCCPNENSFYFTRDGKIYIDGKEVDKREDLKYEGTKDVCISVLADFCRKTISFSMNGNLTQEYTLLGEEFRFIASCCNNATGRVVIEEAESF